MHRSSLSYSIVTPRKWQHYEEVSIVSSSPSPMGEQMGSKRNGSNEGKIIIGRTEEAIEEPMQRKCYVHQVWCRNVPGSPGGAETFTAQWDQLKTHSVSLYIQRLLNNKSTMFRVVRPLYPTTDIPSIIKILKVPAMLILPKCCAFSSHYWQEQ